MSHALQLTPSVAQGVLDHAIERTPAECCGVLLGSGTHARRILRAKNVHENPRTEYEIDPDTLYEAVQRCEKDQVEIVGFYHSHPRGYASFSQTDVARGSWEGKRYLLVSLAPLAFVAGVWNGEDFEEGPVHLEDEAIHAEGSKPP